MLVEKKSSELLAFDLDGTLIHNLENGSRGIPADLLEVVLQLCERYHVVVATGRRQRSAALVLEYLKNLAYLICHNGLMVCDRRGEMIHCHRMQWQTALTIAKEMRQLSLIPVFVMDGSFQSIDFALSNDSDQARVLKKVMSGKFPHTVKALNADEAIQGSGLERCLLEVSTLSDYLTLKEAQQALMHNLPDDLQMVVVETCGYENYSVLEVFPKQVSKWTGVLEVQGLLESKKVYCFGDDENDMQMLENADVGIVMSHARDHVKNRANIEVAGPGGLRDYLVKEFL